MCARIVTVLAVWCALSASASPRAVRAELERRNGPISTLFDAQIEAISDPSLYRCWECTRRAGKTTAAMVEFLTKGQRCDFEFAYIALTKRSARDIAWPILKKLCKQWKIPARFRESMLRVELPSGAALTLYGADRPDWMNRLYGQMLAQVWIDEAAFFESDLAYLVVDVIEPTVTDLEGSITLMSKPGSVKGGYFWKAVTNHEDAPGWSIKRWGWKQNPHIRRQVANRIAANIKKDPKYLERAEVRRNWFNEWRTDDGELVYYGFSPANLIDTYEVRPDDRVVGGIDLGWFPDATAFSIICWSPRHDKVVELESFKATEMLMSQVASRVRMYSEYYPGIRWVCDPDKKQGFEELRRRFQLPLMAADKSDKRYWIDQTNDDFLAGQVQLVDAATRDHQDEMTELQWEERRGLVREKHGQHNDSCDAFLLAKRAAYHYRYKPKKKRIRPGSPEYLAREEARIEAATEARFRS